jgi:hypothetical protein
MSSITPLSSLTLTLTLTLTCHLVISIGFKIADNTRRILLYNRPYQRHKAFFSIVRSIFPVQELCGAMTALALAKKDLLGYKMSYFQILSRSVILHAMANFRGMKPFYIWGSDRPWDELQLQAWNAIDEATPTEMITKTATSLLW